MDEKQNPQNIQQKIYTNSIIELTLPNNYTESKNISFHWKSHTPASYFHTHPTLPHPKSTQKYICSPLDYGSVLNVTIKNDSNDQIYEIMKYGPVQLQPKLGRETECFKEEYDVGVVLSKYFVRKGSLRVKGDPTTVKVEIKLENLQPLQINLNQEVSTEFSKPLLRVYPDEPNCLGIYVYHQFDKLKEILKNLKLWSHFGYHLKILLSNRLERDALILQLLGRSGVSVDEIEPILAERPPKKQKKVEFQVEFGEVANHSHKEPQTKPSSPKLEEEKIIEDIYNILYTPSCSQEIDDDFELSAQKLRKFNALLQSEMIQDFSSEEHSSNEDQSNKTIKQGYIPPWEEESLKKKFGSIILQEPSYGKKLMEISKKKEAKQQEMNEEKIKKLTMEHENLLKENQKLKEENLKLRFQKIKKNSPDSDKMGHIKDIVAVMAKRLEYLESIQLSKKKKHNQLQMEQNREQANESHKQVKKQSKFETKHANSKKNETNDIKGQGLKGKMPKFLYQSPHHNEKSVNEKTIPRSISPSNSYFKKLQKS